MQTSPVLSKLVFDKGGFIVDSLVHTKIEKDRLLIAKVMNYASVINEKGTEICERTSNFDHSPVHLARTAASKLSCDCFN